MDGIISLSTFTTRICKYWDNISNAIEVFLDGQIITDREPCRFKHRFRVIGNSLDGMEPFGQMRDFRIYSGTLEINDIKKIYHRKQDEITNMINKLVTE